MLLNITAYRAGDILNTWSREIIQKITIPEAQTLQKQRFQLRDQGFEPWTP